MPSGWMKKLLQEAGPEAVAQQFGTEAGMPALELAFSVKEPVEVRRRALETLVYAGVDARVKEALSRSLGALTPELRRHLYRCAFSEKAGDDLKKELLAWVAYPDQTLREEVAGLLGSSSDPRLPGLLAECLLGTSLDDLRAACVPLLAAKRGEACLPLLLQALQACNLQSRDDEELVDHLVKAAEDLKASGPEYEGVLVERLREARVSRVPGPRSPDERLRWYRKFDRLLQPTQRIAKALGRVGGEKALAAMLDMFQGPGSGIGDEVSDVDPNAEEIFPETTKAGEAMFYLELAHGIMGIYERFIQSGDTAGLKGIPTFEEFIASVGKRFKLRDAP